MISTVEKDHGLLSKLEFNDEKLKTHLEELILYASSGGADFVELFIEKSDYLGVLAEEEEITSLSPGFGKGVGVRIFKGSKDGFVSTNDLSKQGLIYAIDQALAMLELSTSTIQNNKFDGLNTLKDYSNLHNKQHFLKEAPSITDSCSKLILASMDVGKLAEHIQAKKANYSRSYQEVLVASSDGTFARDIRLHQSYGISLIAVDRAHRSSISRRYGSSDKPRDFIEWNTQLTANEVVESTKNMLYADYVEAGQMPVVLANRFGGVIFHEACGHLLETTQLERRTSPFADKLGKKIAHESVTAIDEGFTHGAFGSISMDDEGMSPQRTVLIEQGILKRFLSDRAGSIRTGHPRTGSGRRQNYSFAPASRMRNTFISAGNYTPEDLIKTVDSGLYCKSMGGGSVGPTGQFNFSVEEGYLIKNGTLTSPVKGATLIGEAKEILPRISMCANDLDLAAGFCGSVSGSVNVTVGQPHIKVDSITIGGR